MPATVHDDVENAMSDSVKLGVMIHRMGVMETTLTEVSTKIDSMGNLYPTMMHIDLLLAPMREKIEQQRLREEARLTEKAKFDTQLKFAVGMAVFSPIVSTIVALVVLK